MDTFSIDYRKCQQKHVLTKEKLKNIWKRLQYTTQNSLTCVKIKKIHMMSSMYSNQWLEDSFGNDWDIVKYEFLNFHYN